MTNNNEKMSREEAGRKGGEATAKKHDKEFFQEMGQKGGEARADQRDGSDDGKMSREEAGLNGGGKKSPLNKRSDLKYLSDSSFIAVQAGT
uniref:stress-induced protein, KGG, repeat-containing protein n=1 Tax=Peribacillus simplex TaxID=1478 RepID=UPI0021A97DDA|nr:stress-induced protein, KGG, repeat-containing protein [Peribacillus simplex]